ncbi:MAG TPA: hypothetical protein H9684_00220 [Firmicutes bacterium]|nr:hypothetical protein [Bacillota bacterium]
MFIKTIRKSTLTACALLAACAGAGAALLAWPEAAASGISRGLSICSSIIIPSLFPFLVLAGFLVKSGLSEALGRRLERPTRFLFGLPGSCAAGILVGFIGGYPAGGIAVGELVERGTITRAQGRRMLCFCVNGGPAFLISAVGAGMLGNVAYGGMLYAAHIAASVLLGILLRLFDGGKEATERPQAPALPRPSPAAAFVEAVNASCRSMLYMCGFILLFAALLALADGSGLTAAVERGLSRPLEALGLETSLAGCLLPCLLEVSCGSVEAAHAGAASPLLLGMTLGWGGLSVHCQVAASLQGKGLVGRGFFAARALHALLGGIFSVLLFRYVPVEAAVFRSSAEALIAPYSSSAGAAVALLAMCALFLLTAAVRPKEGGGRLPSRRPPRS